MIKILQIVPTLGYGGVAQFLLNYYKQMDKNEIRFDFITHGSVEAFHQELIDGGPQIFYFKSIGKEGLKYYLKQLKDVFENNTYDIVHTHDGHLVGLTAFFCRRYFKGKIICHAHTTLCVNPKHRYFMPVFRWLARHNSDKLLGCGVLACRYIFGKGSQFKVIHNAVDVDRFQQVHKEDALALREQLGIPKNAFIIGHVGLFSPQKNHFYLIRIFEKIYHLHKNAHLVLVGGGELQEDVKQECKKMGIEKRIHFVGKQSNIPLYMYIFNVFALPSRWEGLPVVGVEAQAAGLHCVMAEAIDHDVDAGVGMVDFLPITDEALDKWQTTLMKGYASPCRKDIEIAMKATGYEIKGSVDALVNVYKDIVK